MKIDGQKDDKLSRKNRMLVLGLGNDILSDDAVGLKIVRSLKEKFGSGGIDFVETNEMGLSLIDFLEGYEDALLVDSIVTEKFAPGTLQVFDRSSFINPCTCNPHHMGLDEVLAFAEKMKIQVPKNLTVAAVEVKDPFTFREGLTPEVERAVPRLTTKISKMISRGGRLCTSTE